MYQWFLTLVLQGSAIASYSTKCAYSANTEYGILIEYTLNGLYSLVIEYGLFIE